MINVDSKWRRAAKVCWSLSFRYSVYGISAGMVLGFVIGFCMGLAGMDREIVVKFCAIGGLLSSIPIGICESIKILRNSHGEIRFLFVNEFESEKAEQDFQDT